MIRKKTGKLICLSGSALSFCLMVHAQHTDQRVEDLMNEVVEIVSESAENPENIEEIFDDLINFLYNPLNLNTAEAEDLAELQSLNEFQIAVILDYRKTHGRILSVYELVYLPGFREKDVEMIKPYVYCGEINSPANYRLLSPLKGQVLLRYQRIIESQEGYNDPGTGSSYFPGSPDKLYTRIRLEPGDHFEAGLLAEKDAGEEFFKGSNRNGFDFYSGYLGYTNKKSVIKKIVIGDYHIRIGHGLLLHSSNSMGKASQLKTVRELIRPNSSSDENRFFRGTAFTLGKNRYSLTSFFSAGKMDCIIRNDSLAANNIFTGYVNTGLHSTPSEQKHENGVNVYSGGGSFRYRSGNFHMGLNTLLFKTDKSLLADQELYRAFNFTGDSYFGISSDYRYLSRYFQFSGEAAVSNQATAFCNSIRLFIKPEIELLLLYRHYDKNFYSFWSDAFRENSTVSNEKGFFMGSEFNYSRDHLRFYVDIFSFPWLRYRMNSPSQGYEFLCEWDHKFAHSGIGLYFRKKDKPLNTSAGDQLYEVLPLTREQYRIKGFLTAGKYLLLQGRIEIARGGFKADTLKTGILIFHDATLRSLPVPLDISFRVSFFSITDFNARIYAYERDLLYAATSQMYYGTGWRYMLLLKWKASRNMSMWLKYAQTRYPGENTVGSGLNMIQANHRSEIKCQVIYSF